MFIKTTIFLIWLPKLHNEAVERLKATGHLWLTETHKFDFHLFCCTLWKSIPSSSAQLPTAHWLMNHLHRNGATEMGWWYQRNLISTFFAPLVCCWVTFLIVWWTESVGRDLTSIKWDLSNVTLMVFLVNFLCHRRKSWPLNQTTGKRRLQLCGGQRRDKVFFCQPPGTGLNYFRLYLFTDKLKCWSHNGPWTSQMNRVTEKGWLVF